MGSIDQIISGIIKESKLRDILEIIIWESLMQKIVAQEITSVGEKILTEDRDIK